MGFSHIGIYICINVLISVNSDNRTSADETYDDDSEDDPFADSEGGSDYVPSEEDD